MAQLTFHANVSTMGIHDMARNRQSQPGAA